MFRHHHHSSPSPRKYDAIMTQRHSNNDDDDDDDNDDKVLNVHVVPHTHDDVGWLKTVEQYYNGWNNTIQDVCVDDILSSVIEALLEQPHRTFTYVEQKFFTMWWNRQDDPIKETVRHLIHETKQLNFVNGGWCMHDEAATHYIGMIDQTTLGHTFLKQELNVIPKVGWQLDPFGHSATQASLMTYRMGFDALYFGRIDYQDLSLRHATRECEGLWNASTTWKDSSIFWGLTGSYSGNYNPPTGFCFDVNCKEDHPLLPMNHTTLIRAIEDFLLQVRQQSDRTKGNHIMLTMGSDFQYQRAAVNFANTDLLIGTIQRLQEWNQKQELDIPAMFGPRFNKVNIFYSSPEYYTQCKYEESAREQQQQPTGSSHNQLKGVPNRTRSGIAQANVDNSVAWTVKQDDFFPYSDCADCFWTGFFTSRPALKKLERVSSSFLLAARQIESLLDYTGKVDNLQCEDPIHQLEDASGVIQHHDGVSGTSKQHVAYDYAKRVQAGIDAVAPCLVRKLKRLILGKDVDNYFKDFHYCQLLNETKCDVSVLATSENNDVYVVVYNSLGQEKSSTIHLPVSDNERYTVQEEGKTIATTKARSASPFQKNDDGASYVVSFVAERLPPLGAKVFHIQKQSINPGFEGNDEVEPQTDLVDFSNGYFTVKIDTRTGSILHAGTHDKIQNLTTWGYYTSFDSEKDKIKDNDHQNSGAYIFRPSTPDQHLQTIPATNAHVMNISNGIEVHVTYGDWIVTTTRLQKDVPYIEIEYQGIV